jgi:hypothetical protein
MTATPIATVQPEAALELVRLLTGELERLHADFAATQRYLLGQLLLPLRDVLQYGQLDATTVTLLRKARYWGHRLEMGSAFERLNPGFDEVHHGCWPAVPAEARRQAAAQRRELELSMGERFARMLAPAQGGEAA